MKKQILLLLDYRDQFYFSTRYRGACVDVIKLKDYFILHGYDLSVKHFFELDLRNENYKDKWVIYQSSEDPNLHYKDYIEDVILALKMQGAKLIPEFNYFRAHHNNVYMEFLRDLLPIPEIKSITSKSFGTFEEYVKSHTFKSDDPFVIKPGSGTRSAMVSLLDSDSKKKKHSHKISRTFTLDNFKLFLSKLKTGKPFTPMSNNRRKFIIQNFIPNLKGDYRILVYGKKYYVVFRGNRDNSFTASGSGKLDFNTPIPEGLLDYARGIYEKFNTPFMSLDIGTENGNFHLFEFQCLCLGQYTLEKSKFYYHETSPFVWGKVFETPDLEREIVDTIVQYINK
jgi:glutathione synthase/RimK-type ligase-like ATP-grasp enzyme